MTKRIIVTLATVTLMIILLTGAITHSMTSQSVPDPPILPGSGVIDWPLHDISREVLVVKRVVTEAHGELSKITEEYSNELRNDGWSSSYLPSSCDYSRDTTPVWHHSGPFPSNTQWTATVGYYDMGNSIIYMEFTIWSSYRGSDGCSNF